MSRVLGIDPGLDAFACIYDPGRSVASGMRWHFLDVPTRGEGPGRRIKAAVFRDWIMRHSPERAFIENVGPRKGDGIVSASRFVGGARACEAIVECCGVPGVLVAPNRWHGFYEIPAHATKKYMCRLMLQLAPELAPIITQASHHGRAEAGLIAYFGAYTMQPIQG